MKWNTQAKNVNDNFVFLNKLWSTSYSWKTHSSFCWYGQTSTTKQGGIFAESRGNTIGWVLHPHLPVPLSKLLLQHVNIEPGVGVNKQLGSNNCLHYLNDNGVVERLSPEEDERSLKLWVQRVLLRLGPGLLALTVDVYVRIGTCRRKAKRIERNVVKQIYRRTSG